jgi:hypothetical protein
LNVKNEAELTRTERVAIFLRDNKKSLIIAEIKKLRSQCWQLRLLNPN